MTMQDEKYFFVDQLAKLSERTSGILESRLSILESKIDSISTKVIDMEKTSLLMVKNSDKTQLLDQRISSLIRYSFTNSSQTTLFQLRVGQIQIPCRRLQKRLMDLSGWTCH